MNRRRMVAGRRKSEEPPLLRQSCGKFLEGAMRRAGVSSMGCWPTKIARMISGERYERRIASMLSSRPARSVLRAAPTPHLQGRCAGAFSLR